MGLTSSDDHTARLWNVPSLRESLSLSRCVHGLAVLGAHFSPDGRRIVPAISDRMPGSGTKPVKAKKCHAGTAREGFNDAAFTGRRPRPLRPRRFQLRAFGSRHWETYRLAARVIRARWFVQASTPIQSSRPHRQRGTALHASFRDGKGNLKRLIKTESQGACTRRRAVLQSQWDHRWTAIETPNPAYGIRHWQASLGTPRASRPVLRVVFHPGLAAPGNGRSAT